MYHCKNFKSLKGKNFKRERACYFCITVVDVFFFMLINLDDVYVCVHHVSDNFFESVKVLAKISNCCSVTFPDSTIFKKI